MRSTTWPASACLAFALFGSAASAQDGPAEVAPARSTVASGGYGGVRDRGDEGFAAQRLVLARRPGAAEKGAFLGLATSPAQPALQKQLQLKPGVGLVVDGVEPGSPAEQAGVREFDILHKLDDQVLVNEEQLAVLVRTYEPGGEVTLTVIREGKPQQLKAKLAERELPLLRLSFQDPNIPAVQYGRVSLARDRNNAVQFLTRGELLEAAGDVVEMRSPDGQHSLKAARVTIEDERHKVTVSSRDGRKHLRVEDKSGKVLFEGPIETEEELQRIPAYLRQVYTNILLDHARDVKPPAPAPAPAPGVQPQPVPVAPPTPEAE